MGRCWLFDVDRGHVGRITCLVRRLLGRNLLLLLLLCTGNLLGTARATRARLSLFGLTQFASTIGESSVLVAIVKELVACGDRDVEVSKDTALGGLATGIYSLKESCTLWSVKVRLPGAFLRRRGSHSIKRHIQNVYFGGIAQPASWCLPLVFVGVSSFFSVEEWVGVAVFPIG